MKYAILQAVRLAFHYSLESFIMGEFTLPSNEELEVISLVKSNCLNRKRSANTTLNGSLQGRSISGTQPSRKASQI